VSVRANLIDFPAEKAEKDPRSLFDLPVEMVTEVVAKDREGHDVVRFCYRPKKWSVTRIACLLCIAGLNAGSSNREESR
jgi:hypothetical protein